VRFRPILRARYYRTRDIFAATTRSHGPVLVRWKRVRRPRLAGAYLHRVGSCGDDRSRDGRACEVSRSNPELRPSPTRAGRAAYVLAGSIPNDPVRARWFHPASDLAQRYPAIPFARLPKSRHHATQWWDGEQQDVWPEVSARAESPVRDALSCLSDSAASSGATDVRRGVFHAKCNLTFYRFRNAISRTTFRRRSAIATRHSRAARCVERRNGRRPRRRRRSLKACACS